MAVHILLGWASATLGLWVAANVLRGVRLQSLGDAIWAGALLGVLHWALAVPLTVLIGIGTLGLGLLFWFITYWIASAVVILLASAVSHRLDVDGFWNALLTAFIVAAAGSVLRWLV